MGIQRQQAAIFMGMSGIVTFTATLISQAEALTQNSQSSGMTMNELAQCGQSSVTFPNPFSPTKFLVSFAEIKQAFPDADFENSVVIADIRFQPDPLRNPTRYPSDMVDELRSLGLAEDKIQELVAGERAARGN